MKLYHHKLNGFVILGSNSIEFKDGVSEDIEDNLAELALSVPGYSLHNTPPVVEEVKPEKEEPIKDPYEEDDAEEETPEEETPAKKTWSRRPKRTET